MPTIANIKIGQRLALGFSIVLLCAIALLGLGLWQMSQMQTLTDAIVNDEAAGLDAATSMRENGGALALILRKLSAPTDVAEQAQESKRLVDTLAAYDRALRHLLWHSASPEGMRLLTQVQARQAVVMPMLEQVRRQAADGNYFDAALAVKALSGPHEQWMAALSQLADHRRAAMKEAAAASGRHYQAAMLGMWSLGGLALALGAVIAWLTTRTITAPLHHAGRIAGAIATGDLSQEIGSAPNDETGALVRALQTMQHQLIGAVRQIQHGACNIGVAAREIAIGNADLSARTEAQAGSQEHTASAMQALTGAVGRNAGHARQANDLVLDAAAVAATGGRLMTEVVDTMRAIQSSARKIADITGVIDGIAFQTNILALNAAVEAARAGEQGRGFAVVASEVRQLAQRSAAAAREIKILIGDSVGMVDGGSRLVDIAGQTMARIVTSVQSVAAIMADIAAASEAQSTGLQDISQAMARMDDMTQQNAALVEQAAAAAASLQIQAERLEQAVAIFRLAPVPSTVPVQMAYHVHTFPIGNEIYS
ncbi:HAMP domain-containing protein [Duganella sp. FT92W]|uniref:HAMP domain-containing protein n=1 Tax=Pseudoduganella rivuli TaxID=2666085 RepID=A0A7X2INS4_9BURK|nr:methyl-accepting chemotaxis protein [Pseudoduganella rivuli]MRV72982.1 HAMP domain-containing protein [Pseudoduganella rivuli]